MESFYFNVPNIEHSDSDPVWPEFHGYSTLPHDETTSTKSPDQPREGSSEKHRFSSRLASKPRVDYKPQFNFIQEDESYKEGEEREEDAA